MGPVLAVRSAAATAAGGWRSGEAPQIHYGLCLRLAESHDQTSIHHVPATFDTGARREIDAAKTESFDQMRRASLKRLALPAAAYSLHDDGASLAPAPTVSVIIPTRDRLSLLRAAIAAVRSNSPSIAKELIIVDNGSTDPETISWLQHEARTSTDLQMLHQPGAFNFSALNNAGAALASGDVLAFLNNDVQSPTADLFATCSQLSLHPTVGATGPLLVYASGRIQHAGIVLGPGGIGANALAGAAIEEMRQSDVFPAITRSVSALTGACLFVERRKFHDVGGFEQELAVAFNDIDLCLRLESCGLTNVVLPGAWMVHLESQTRIPDRNYDAEPRLRAEYDFMRARWGARLDWDPWVSNAIRVDNGRPEPFWGRQPSERKPTCT